MQGSHRDSGWQWSDSMADIYSEKTRRDEGRSMSIWMNLLLKKVEFESY